VNSKAKRSASKGPKAACSEEQERVKVEVEDEYDHGGQLPCTCILWLARQISRRNILNTPDLNVTWQLGCLAVGDH
jgi:hypothetical protein